MCEPCVRPVVPCYVGEVVPGGEILLQAFVKQSRTIIDPSRSSYEYHVWITCGEGTTI